MDEGCVVTMAERDGVLAPNACFFFFCSLQPKRNMEGGEEGKQWGLGGRDQRS